MPPSEMSSSDYLVAITLAVLVLAVTKLLRFWGRIAQIDGPARVPNLIVLWSITCLIFILQYWWALHSVKHILEVNFLVFLVFLIEPIAMLFAVYFLAHFDRGEYGATGYNIRRFEFQWESRYQDFILMICLVIFASGIQSSVEGHFMGQERFWSSDDTARSLGILLLLSSLVFRGDMYRGVVWLATTVMLIAFVVFHFPDLKPGGEIIQIVDFEASNPAVIEAQD